MKKPKLRFWIEILAVGSGIACILAVFFATLGAATGAAEDAPAAPQAAQTSAQNSTTSAQNTEPTPAAALPTYEGVVTDTKCGAKHTPAIPESAADCVRACVHSGEKFALVDGDKVYVLDGQPELLKHAAGERVMVGGTLTGNTISVASVREITP